MRYKDILNKRIENELKEKKKEEKLKRSAGLTEAENVTVRRNTGNRIARNIIFGFLAVIRYILAAIGVLTLLEPTLRVLFLSQLMSLFG